MSKTALVDALKKLDLDTVRRVLERTPALRHLRLGKGVDLLQFCSQRSTADDAAAADRQLRPLITMLGFLRQADFVGVVGN